MGDVDDDGVLDLIVGAGKDHAPEVVAYAGRGEGGKGAFETELARFQAFDAAARGGVSVAAAQIDGTTVRQHHRRIGSRHPERGEGLSNPAAVFGRRGAGAVLDVQAVW